ncbi:Z1 domain-containing protein [Fulvivirga sedimenti]|uniref:Z1 domain-containing protein n=1 Tax=Fulvivirga sedimenti TaxID=2879465 RepID=A0A9X1HSI3_9BACT|nr:Z1 domain-containing protein [Fulvivirga sedimenti]MCA6075599.1 Z1 domain-containing protein [Fulvivirga sedimenti]
MLENIEIRIGFFYSLLYSNIDHGFIKEDEIDGQCEKLYSILSEEEKSIIDSDSFKSRIKDHFKKQETPPTVKDDTITSWIQTAWRKSPRIHWLSYKDYLVSQGKSYLIPKIDVETAEILNSCKNPSEDEDKYWDRRGLVYGHVQSGKTANYLGLINKAFDTGYRHIIVFTGMTEDLRRQTQERIDEGVTGRNMNNLSIGVGKFRKNGFNIRSATNIDLDLSRGAIDHLQNNLLHKDRSIWVVKKNKTVLEHLIKWLDSQRNHQGTEKIKGAPFLIIDDEADNASIQSLSKKDFEILIEGLDIRDQDEKELSDEDERKLNEAKEREIKAINRYIRVILSLIGQKTFVAYTATPYSVINQTRDDVEHEVNIGKKKYMIEEDSDLFPEHFIIPLEPGNGYMGLLRMFNQDEPIPVLTNITDSEEYARDEKLGGMEYFFPRKRGYDYKFDEIPRSLQEAIFHFIVTIYVRKYRGQNGFNSMLVHTSHLTTKTDYLAWKIDEFVTQIRNLIIQHDPKMLSGFKNALNSIVENSKNPILDKYYGTSSYKTPEDINYSDVLKILDSTENPFEIVSYHSSTRNPDLKHHYHDLSYRSNSDRKVKVKNYIVIGGNRLSRGLTLEGLSTSYFARNSSRQDSLYQMGRWFGYRNGFEDCVRIFMPGDQIDWYMDIARLEQSLRKDLMQMNEPGIGNRILPRDWVIKLANSKSMASLQNRIHPCDPLKLRHTQKTRMSFGGAVERTLVFQRDNEIQKDNFLHVKSFIDSLYIKSKLSKVDEEIQGYNYGPSKSNLNFEKVSPEEIIEFIRAFQFHSKYESTFKSVAKFIESNESKFNSFSVVLKQLESNTHKIDMYEDWCIGDHLIHAVGRSDINKGKESDDYEIGAILDSDKDNTFDLINSENIEYYNQLSGSDRTNYRNLERDKSKKGLLIIYLVKGKIVNTEAIIPAIHLTIPKIDNEEKVTYIVRKKREKQLK